MVHTFAENNMLSLVKQEQGEPPVHGVLKSFSAKPKDSSDQGRKWLVVYIPTEKDVVDRFLLRFLVDVGSILGKLGPSWSNVGHIPATKRPHDPP